MSNIIGDQESSEIAANIAVENSENLQISPKILDSCSRSLENLHISLSRRFSVPSPQSQIPSLQDSPPEKPQRKYSSHDELALNVTELLAEEQRISNFGHIFVSEFFPEENRSAGSSIPIIRSESLENFADFSSNVPSSHDCCDQTDESLEETMARNPPVTLATVLENMPLVYNSYTKNLEKYRSAPTEEPKAENLSDSGAESSPEIEIRTKSHKNVRSSPISPKKPLLGHSDSFGGESCGLTKNCDDDDCIPEISLVPTSPKRTSPRASNDASPCSGKHFTGQSATNKPFKKGHVRHSSYETASITLQPLPLVTKEQNAAQAAAAVLQQSGAPPPAGMNRTQSLHRTTDSLSSSVSIGSLSFYSDYSASAASIEAGATCLNQAREQDSALGDSASSKRSSLDRRSQCSALSGDWLESETGQSGNPDQLLDNAVSLTTKRKGLALPSILPRGFFSRKNSNGPGASTSTSISGPWRLFSRGGAAAVPQSAASQGSTTPKGSVTSTTGLILEDRPSNLPAKSEAEASKHRQEYERMMELAKRKEQKDAKARKRAEEQKKRQEEQLTAACRIWTQEIVPKWDDMRYSKRCKELWWQGLPPSVRGKIWRLAVGNDLNLTSDLYEICSARAKEKLAEAAQEKENASKKCSTASESRLGGAVEQPAACTPVGDRTSSVTIVADEENLSPDRSLKNSEQLAKDSAVKTVDDHDKDGSSDLETQGAHNGKVRSHKSILSIGSDWEENGGWELSTTNSGCGWSIGDRMSTNGDMPPILEVEGSLAVNRESTVHSIYLDVNRTFPNLGIFQEGGPYYDLLLNLLGAYVCYRPDVGYVQGMSFLAAVLLLQMDASEAFVVFANLLNRPLQLAFFRLRQPEMTHYFIAYDQYFKQELPKLHAHMDELDVRPDLYLIEWVYSLYAKSLPLDVTCRVWDVYLRDGEEFLFKTALGILRLHEEYLLSTDFDQCVQFLNKLPPDAMNGPDLFRNIEPFMRSPAVNAPGSGRRTFGHILADCAGVLGGRSPLGSNSPVPSNLAGQGGSGGSLRPGHVRKTSNGSLASTNSTTTMSKSLSGLLGDWLGTTELANNQ